MSLQPEEKFQETSSTPRLDYHHDPLQNLGYEVPKALLSLLISSGGATANALSLSYFLKKENKNLGDQILVLLNSLDLMMCALTFVDVICRSWLEDKVINSPELFWVLQSLYYFVFSESTAFTTCLLSVIRSISLTFPFYSLNKRAVQYGTILYFLYLLSREVTLLVLQICYELKDITDNSDMISFCTLILILSIVLISNSVTGYKLLFLRDRTPRVNSGANTKRAGVTVFILSSFFIFFNLLYIVMGGITIFYREIIDGLQYNDYRVILAESVIQFSIPLNSACNPIIYFCRKATMRDYVRGIFGRSTLLNSSCFRQRALMSAPNNHGE